MQGVGLPAVLGTAEVLPVGGLIESAGKARFPDEGFEQDRLADIAALPVIGHAAADQGEPPRGRVFCSGSTPG